jgi:hypothetical protein
MVSSKLSHTFAQAMKLLRLFLLMYISVPLPAIAQGSSNLTDTLSWVSGSPMLNTTVVRLKEINSSKQSMPGYRIQIYFGSQRSKANELRARFAARFPNINAVVSYHQPNFKVRAGDFRTRMEAQSKLEMIEKEFPGAFVVPDEIRLPPLK